MKKTRSTRALCIALVWLCCLLSGLPLLAGCNTQPSEPITRNAITDVTVDRDAGDGSGSLTVRAELTASLLGSHDGPVYLFELPVHRSHSNDLRGLSPIAEAKATARPAFSLSLYDGTRSRLTSSFLLASYDEQTKQYAVLTAPVAVSDPARPSGEPVHAQIDLSVKGLSTPHPADAMRLGAASTLVDVSMGDLIRSSWTEGAVSFQWNGTTFHYDGDAVRELDETIAAYTACGIRVYLRFQLKAPGDDTPSCLYVPGVRSDAEGYLPNSTDPAASRLLEAFFAFASARYATGAEAPGRGLCTSFLIGRGVNGIGQTAEDGSRAADPDAHVSRYEQLVRLAYTILRDATPDGRVFISLNSHWSGRDLSDGVGAQAYLAAFRSVAALRGDFDWQVACELSASSPRVWQSSAADGDKLTVSSLSTLTDLLSADTYRLPGGGLRQVIIPDYAIPAAFADEVSPQDAAQADAYQAASYAFAYAVASGDARVEALIYDGTAPGAQLYDTDADGVFRRRPLGDTFAVVDTDGAESVLSVARHIVGTAFLRVESGQSGKSLPTRTIEGGVAVLPTAQMSDKSSTSLLRFDTLVADGQNPYGGFTSVEGLTYLERVAESSRPVLHAALEAPTAGMPVGITTALPVSSLTGARELLLDIKTLASDIAMTGESRSSDASRMTVLLTRTSRGTVENGEGTLRYAATVTLSAGDWQTLRCDVSGFTDLLAEDDTVLLTILTASDATTAYDLYLREVKLTGASAAPAPTALILTVVGIAVLVLIGVVVFLFLRSRRRAELSVK